MTHRNVELTALAAEQILEAREWWLENRDKAVGAFDADLDSLLLQLEDRPGLVGRPVKQDQRVRRVYLRRIRYFVYFQIVDDRVRVLALWHGSRDGGPPTGA